eukprot:8325378-Lingulodinium_polyedra.AAC.1
MTAAWPKIAVPIQHSNKGANLRDSLWAVEVQYGIHFLLPRLDSGLRDPMSEKISFCNSEFTLQRVNAKTFRFKCREYSSKNFE